MSDCLGRPRRFGREGSSTEPLAALDESLGAFALLPCCGCKADTLSESSLFNDGRPRRFFSPLVAGSCGCELGSAAFRGAPFARVLDFPLSVAAVGCASWSLLSRLTLGPLSGSFARRSRPLRLGADVSSSWGELWLVVTFSFPDNAFFLSFEATDDVPPARFGRCSVDTCCGEIGWSVLWASLEFPGGTRPLRRGLEPPVCCSSARDSICAAPLRLPLNGAVLSLGWSSPVAACWLFLGGRPTLGGCAGPLRFRDGPDSVSTSSDSFLRPRFLGRARSSGSCSASWSGAS